MKKEGGKEKKGDNGKAEKRNVDNILEKKLLCKIEK